MSKLTEASLDDVILNATEAAYKTVPKEVIDALSDKRRTELLYDLGEGIELVLRDHLSITPEEFAAKADEGLTETATVSIIRDRSQ